MCLSILPGSLNGSFFNKYKENKVLQFSDLKVGMSVRSNTGMAEYSVDGVGSDWAVLRRPGTSPFSVKNIRRFTLCKPKHKRYYFAYKSSISGVLTLSYRNKSDRDKRT
jgi:hypothetical protein